MLTFNKNISITKNNHVMSIDLPSLAEGEYKVLVVVGEKIKTSKTPLSFASYKINIEEGQTFSRQDLYDDNGR